VVLASTKAAEVKHDRDNQEKQIDSCRWLSRIHDPCVDQGGEWQKYESQQRQKQTVIGVLKVIGEQK
jgi:hypothetical protein